MFTEKSPLRGGQGPEPYVFTSPQRMYKKKVKQLQCYLCGIVMALFALALLCAILFSVNEEEIIANGRNDTDQTPVLYMTPPDGKQPDSPNSLTLGKSGDSTNLIKKLYTSATVIGGKVSARLDDDQPVDLFTGLLPATIHLDSIINETAWGAISSQVKWSGVAQGKSIKGTFSLPARVGNETKTWNGNFSLDLEFKWSGSLDMVESKKLYDCKVLFMNYKKAALAPQDVPKGKTATDEETCSIFLSGSFYEPSFFCYITPWWCTKEKLFYWDGGIELKVTQPLPQPSNSTVAPKQILKAGGSDSQTKIMGSVTSGSVKLADSITGEKVQVWSGEFPADIDLSLFPTGKAKEKGEYPLIVSWSGSVTESGVQGSFKLPKMSGWIDGDFTFQVNSTEFARKLIDGVTYKSPVYLHETGGPFPVLQADPTTESTALNISIVILGKRVGSSFSWNGQFIIIFKESSAQKIPPTKFVLGAKTPGTKILGSVTSGWLKLVDPVTGGKTEVWNGTIPQEMRLPELFNSKSVNKSYPLTASWSCTMFHSTIQGTVTFSKPQVKGVFMLKVNSNAYGLADLLIPGITYNSPIYLHDSKGQNFSNIPSYYSEDKMAGDEIVIVLLGKRNGKSFSWDGQFVAVHNQAPSVEELSVLRNPPVQAYDSRLDIIPSIIANWKLGSKILGKATSGWLSVVSDTGVSRTVWNGEIPANITLPVFWTSDTGTANASSLYSHGIVWSCSAFQSSVRGTFQLPQYAKGGLVKWVRGEFYVQLKPNPVWSFYDIFVPGINYNSPIHFRNSGSLDVGSVLVPYRTHQEPGSEVNGLKAPVILLGKRTKSMFSWNGSFIALVSAVGQ